MDVALSVGRVLLAVVFALAAAGKLIDQPGTRRALVDFGVARGLSGVGAVLLTSQSKRPDPSPSTGSETTAARSTQEPTIATLIIGAGRSWTVWMISVLLEFP